MARAARSPHGGDRPSLSVLLDRTADTVSQIGPQFMHYSRKLNGLADRYAEGRFHLAVLGQFKRGKSTLLNALMGEPILPVGVVPLTAAPTFIQYGQAPKICVRRRDGRRDLLAARERATGFKSTFRGCDGKLVKSATQ